MTKVDRDQIRALLTASREQEPDRFARAPLPYPKEFNDQIDTFVVVAQRAFAGDVDGAGGLFSTIDGQSLMEWYDTVAQNVADVRYTLISGNPPRRRSGEGEHPTPSPARVAAIAARDGYRCGYCGIRVIEPEILKKIQMKVGRDIFPSKSNKKGSTNRDYHGIWVTTAVTLDHVVPYSESGDDSDSNLITSCWGCNFGKYDYTCEELGLRNPGVSMDINSMWRGLRDIVR